MGGNMSDRNQFFFPRFLDKPGLIGIFEMDEFFLGFGIIFFVLLLSMAFPEFGGLSTMLLALTLGLSAAALYRRFKKNNPDGYTLQKLYRKGIYSPTDSKLFATKYKHLSKIERIVPYGFTTVFYS